MPSYFFKAVTVKMLPFDNKSEVQVIIDMPGEHTRGNSRRIPRDRITGTVPEVLDYELYTGTAAPLTSTAS
jgi:hypothetical protein